MKCFGQYNCIHFIIAFLYLAIIQLNYVSAQNDGPGIGLYPTGTEAGLGYRSSKNTRIALDIRIARSTFNVNLKSGTMVNEISCIYRLAYFEKIRFHLGMGLRLDWDFARIHTRALGLVIPIGIEAFPFPFRNGGLFFETAPYLTRINSDQNIFGIRTAAGIIFYFIEKNKDEKIQK